MPPNDTTGICHDCEREYPTYELTQLREGGEIMILCDSCRVSHCEHPEGARSTTPMGRPKCNLCDGVLTELEDKPEQKQATLGGF